MKKKLLCLFLIAFFSANLFEVSFAGSVEVPESEEVITSDEKSIVTVYDKIREFHLPALAKQALVDQQEADRIEKENQEFFENWASSFDAYKLPSLGQAEKIQLVYEILKSQIIKENQEEDLKSEELTLNVSSENIPFGEVANDNVYSDVEVFSGADEDLYLFERLDNTLTTFGKVELQKMLYSPIKDVEILRDRQEIVKHLLTNSELFENLNRKIEEIKNLEDELIWFWKSFDALTTLLIDGWLYFEKGMFWDFRGLNKNSIALELLYLKQALLGPLVGFYGIYSLTPDNARQTVQDFRDKKLFKSAWRALGIYYSVSGQLIGYPMWAIKVHKFMNDIHNRMAGVAGCVKSLKSAGDYIGNQEFLREVLPEVVALKDLETDGSEEFAKFIKMIEGRTFQRKPSLLSNKGKILASFKMMMDVKEHFSKSLQILGKLDAYLSIAKLYKKFENNQNARFCFAQYVRSDRPYLNINKFWHPFLDEDTVVTNNIELGGESGERNVILTGPNAAGKSTILKSIMISILLAQTIGIVPSDEMVFTPFSKFHTYLNITDSSGVESLYQAEMRRAQELIAVIKSLPAKEFSFIILDEIFTGTNPEEGMAGAYAVINSIGKFENNMGFMATHFHEITELERVSGGTFKNYHVCAEKNKEGKIVYPYKLSEGFSEQKIALDLLKERGFDADLLKQAERILIKST